VCHTGAVEFFLLVAAVSLGWMGLFPWVLARSRREEVGPRWPRRIVRTRGIEHAGDGAYREADVAVERVVAIEPGPPAEVVRGGRRAFSSAALMFVGGVLGGAWVPVQLWLTRTYVENFTLAYLAGALVAGGWVLAAFAQFRAAWARWEPAYGEAIGSARTAARAASGAAVLSLASVVLVRWAHGPVGTLVPVWFSLVAGLRAWWTLRAVLADRPLYPSAQDTEVAARAGGSEPDATGVRVAVDGPDRAGARGDVHRGDATETSARAIVEIEVAVGDARAEPQGREVGGLSDRPAHDRGVRGGST
jgi:hypothetical protein